MKLKIILSIVSLIVPLSAFASEMFYCPQHQAFIRIGMTMDQVSAACGPPMSDLVSNVPLYNTIQVQQLIYNNQGTDLPFSNENPDNPFRYNYLFWAPLKSGSGGAQMEVNIVDNKVKLFRINSSNNNAANLCNGYHIQIGDPVGRVYSQCGSPSIINTTYMKEFVPVQGKPKVWVYRLNEFQPAVTLTFVNGHLQSIE